jgi:ankyrin repeat protein
LTGDSSLVTKLLKAGVDINNTDDADKPSTLYGAVDSGSLKLVKTLLQKGADVNKGSQYKMFGYPHTLATDKEDLEMVRALLTGANLNV